MWNVARIAHCETTSNYASHSWKVLEWLALVLVPADAGKILTVLGRG